jgi:hypothetical protein
MRILLDENLPQKLRLHLTEHNVFTIGYMGWKGLTNGQLLSMAEQHFDAFITIDRNIQFQQNVGTRDIGIILLVAPNNQLQTLVPFVPEIEATLATLKPGELILLKGRDK